MTLFLRDGGIAKMALTFMSEAEFRGTGLDGIGVRIGHTGIGKTILDYADKLVDWPEGLISFFAITGLASAHRMHHLVGEAAHRGNRSSLKFLLMVDLDRDIALSGAARGNQIRLMHEFKSEDLECAVENACENGNVAALKLLRSWGVCNSTLIMEHAANHGQIRVMKIAKKWGCKHYSIKSDSPKITRLLRKWRGAKN